MGIYETGRFQDSQKVAPAYVFLGPFGTTWRILGATCGPLGGKWRPKGSKWDPKSIKNRFQNQCKGRCRKRWKNDAKMDRSWSQNDGKTIKNLTCSRKADVARTI